MIYANFKKYYQYKCTYISNWLNNEMQSRCKISFPLVKEVFPLAGCRFHVLECPSLRYLISSLCGMAAPLLARAFLLEPGGILLPKEALNCGQAATSALLCLPPSAARGAL